MLMGEIRMSMYICVTGLPFNDSCLCTCVQKQRSQWNDIIKTIYLHGLEHSVRKMVGKMHFGYISALSLSLSLASYFYFYFYICVYRYGHMFLEYFPLAAQRLRENRW